MAPLSPHINSGIRSGRAKLPRLSRNGGVFKGSGVVAEVE